MFSQKQIEKYKRTKYIRELERFLNRIVSYVQKEQNLDKEQFQAYVDEIFKPLEKIEKVRFNGPYHTHLERFVEQSANLPTTDLQMDEIKKEILHSANQLQKTKRKKNFKTQKHKGKQFD